MAEIGTDVSKAKTLLEAGKLVAIPTETVYGLAGNALNVDAITAIFKTKNRPAFDPLIIHVPDADSLLHYVTEVPEKAQLLAQQFWPGPLTLLLNKKRNIPDLVTSGLSSVAVRCPDHTLTRQLLRDISFPLAAPSANPFGYVSPTRPEHVAHQLGEQIEYILDGGPCRVGIESTIVGFENDQVIIYRLGGLSVEAIETIVGSVSIQTHSVSDPKAPGQLKSHYAPAKQVLIGSIPALLQQHPAYCTGILSFKNDYHSPYQFVLSHSGDVDEAAQNLFTALRILDTMPVKIILAEFVPDEGLGRAINDRLRRAAAEK